MIIVRECAVANREISLDGPPQIASMEGPDFEAALFACANNAIVGGGQTCVVDHRIVHSCFPLATFHTVRIYCVDSTRYALSAES